MKKHLYKFGLTAMLAVFGLSNIAYTQTITDARDGQVYEIVTIGTQVWMKENLNYKQPISSMSAYYNDDSATYAPTYGRLYNWFDATNGICPSDYHLPSNDEWTTLITYLGGTDLAGGKMKEAGTTHWTPNNTGGDNSSGFTALPGGYKYAGFTGINTTCLFWTSSEEGMTNARHIGLIGNQAKAYQNNSNKGSNLYSIRCVSNTPAGMNDNIDIPQINMYPNPTNGNINIEWNGNKTATLQVMNTLGEIVIEQQITTTTSLELTSKGIYFVKIIDGTNYYTKKIIVQ